MSTVDPNTSCTIHKVEHLMLISEMKSFCRAVKKACHCKGVFFCDCFQYISELSPPSW
ncbi:hypothetical protein KP509_11G018900 [Ceratopteris richardii]|uniref:Uncharacterized protein n=1 Tax=Ceratopteris richardii TaxID=49495 RepID=A0A8T2TMH6_CERRI|nr:hypothetical protein KP509_11G018900 [Ceratopteris richardii]